MTYLCLTLCAFVVQACGDDKHRAKSGGEAASGLQPRSLQQIVESGKLRAYTTYSATGYFLYNGEPMGFEYEMLKRFASSLDIELELIVSHQRDSVFDLLESAEIDLAAMSLTVTKERRQRAAFSEPLYLTRQVLVQRKPPNWRRQHWSRWQQELIREPLDLIGDTVSARVHTSFMQRLHHLSEELGGEIIVDSMPGHLSTEEILHMVARGEIKQAISDENLASFHAAYLPELDIQVPISFSQQVAWAVHPQADDLLFAINTWLQEEKRKPDFNVIYKKYFRHSPRSRQRLRSQYYSLRSGAIGPYDAVIRESAMQIGWDWRLLASLIFQESRFDSLAESAAGAMGLMQIMPATAMDLGLSDVLDSEQNIRAGARYLQSLWDRFEDIPDSTDRYKFTLAAYNAGFGRIRDAQRLTEKYEKDPLRWEDNVADMVLAMSEPEYYQDSLVRYGRLRGRETYYYVQEIFERYRHYCGFIDS